MRLYLRFTSSTTLNSEIIKKGFTYKQNYFNNLSSADNFVSCSIPFNETIANNIKNHINDNIPAYILNDDNTIYFNGYLKKSADFEKESNVKEISLEIVSPSYFLDLNVKTPYVTTNITLANAVKYLIQQAGIVSYRLNNLPDITLKVFEITKDDNYKNVIAQLLKEYGYTYDFDNEGYFICNPLFNEYDTITQVFVDGTSGNILGSLQQKVEEREYNGVKASYDKLITPLVAQVVFLDESEHVLEAGKYLYDDTNGTYAEYDCKIGEVKTVTEITWSIKFETFTLTNQRPQYDSFSATVKNCGTKALIKVHNGSVRTGKVQKVVIMGKGCFVQSKATAATVNGKNYDEVSLRYVFDNVNASAFAKKLCNYYKYANFTISLNSKTDFEYGSFVKVTAGKMGTINGRIIQKTKHLETSVISYEIESVDAYENIGISLDNTIKNAALTTSSLSEINENIGEQVSQIVSNTQTHYLATDLSSGVTINTPGWTTGAQAISEVNRYLWTYQSISYSDGETTTTVNSDPVISGVYGEKGATGTARILANLYEDGTENENAIYNGKVYIYISGVWTLTDTSGYLGVMNDIPDYNPGNYFMAKTTFNKLQGIYVNGKILKTKSGAIVGVNVTFQKGYLYYCDGKAWKKLSLDDYRYVAVMIDSYHTTGQLPPAIEEATESTVISRVGSFNGLKIADIANPVRGDFYCYNGETTETRKKGYLYKYNGENWEEVDPSDPQNYNLQMQALNSSLEIANPEVGAFSTLFANILMANKAVIEQLQTQVIMLSQGGKIQSVNYEESVTEITGITGISPALITIGHDSYWVVKAFYSDRTSESLGEYKTFGYTYKILNGTTEIASGNFLPFDIQEYANYTIKLYYGSTLLKSGRIGRYYRSGQGFYIKSNGEVSFQGNVLLGANTRFNGIIDNVAIRTNTIAGGEKVIWQTEKTMTFYEFSKALTSQGYLMSCEGSYRSAVAHVNNNYTSDLSYNGFKNINISDGITNVTNIILYVANTNGAVTKTDRYTIKIYTGVSYTEYEGKGTDQAGIALTCKGNIVGGVSLFFPDLPSSAPSEQYRIWNDNGYLRIVQ